VVTAATVRAALFAISAVAAMISPLACMAPAATPVPTAIASVTGLARAAPKFALAVRPALGAARCRLDGLFAGLCLRDVLALFEGALVGRGAAFDALRPRALLPLRDLVAGAFLAAAVLRDGALEALFLDAAFFAAGRPRAFVPRRDFDAVVFGDLAIHNSFETGLI
jgi:hypothetical protein